MKAKELQVGDFVWIADDTYVKVEQITKKKIGYHFRSNECRMHYARLADVEPVEITEDVLEKNLSFGRNQMYGSPAWEYNIDNKVDLSVEKGCAKMIGRDWSLFCMDTDRSTLCGCDIQYLHQLQQIVRFVTGKELEVML